jgi:hypothetical protein
LEARGITVAESQLVLAAMAALPSRAGVDAISMIAKRLGQREVEQVIGRSLTTMDTQAMGRV